ncbi:MAG: M16 family metallopeptidase, partial [Vicinamibacterales bacterium]
ATTVVAVGDVDAEALLDGIAAEFQDWRGQAPPVLPTPAPPPRLARALVVKPMPDKAQADVAYGFVGMARQDSDYYAALVMNNALGQYAMGGRLGDSIRERQGMAYYVYSALDAGREAGPLMVRAGVAAANVERTIASIDTELAAVLSQGFTATEVDDAKRYLIGSLPRQLETNGGIAGFLLATELYGLGIDHDVRLPRLIDAVTPDDVARVARRLLDPARAVVVVAGPWSGPAA